MSHNPLQVACWFCPKPRRFLREGHIIVDRRLASVSQDVRSCNKGQYWGGTFHYNAGIREKGRRIVREELEERPVLGFALETACRDAHFKVHFVFGDSTGSVKGAGNLQRRGWSYGGLRYVGMIPTSPKISTYRFLS